MYVEKRGREKINYPLKFKYFREDPLVNSHHYHWHMTMSNTAVPTWHPSYSGRLDR